MFSPISTPNICFGFKFPQLLTLPVIGFICMRRFSCFVYFWIENELIFFCIFSVGVFWLENHHTNHLIQMKMLLWNFTTQNRFYSQCVLEMRFSIQLCIFWISQQDLWVSFTFYFTLQFIVLKVTEISIIRDLCLY